jgi:hypothetical protein
LVVTLGQRRKKMLPEDENAVKHVKCSQSA